MLKKIVLLVFLSLVFSCEDPVSTMLLPPVTETRITVNTTPGQTTVVDFDYPVIVCQGAEYNVEEMTEDVFGLPVCVTREESIRRVTVDMSFSDYAYNAVQGWDLSDLSVPEFAEVLTLIYEPPAPPPDYSLAMYSLLGITSGTPDSFQAGSELVRINGVTYPDSFFPYSTDPLIVHITIKISADDSWFYYGDNLMTYFGIDHTFMTRDELIQMAQMLEMMPEKNWMEIKEIFNP